MWKMSEEICSQVEIPERGALFKNVPAKKQKTKLIKCKQERYSFSLNDWQPAVQGSGFFFTNKVSNFQAYSILMGKSVLSWLKM